MNLKFFFPIIIASLLLSITAAGKGYKVVLDTTKGDTTTYVLGGWKWGEKFKVDTVKASSGKATFSAKEDLDCGNYAIYDLSGRKQVEFIVPRKNGNFSIRIAKDGESFAVKKGNGENKLFVGFQNFLNYGWNRMSSAEEFAQKLLEMRDKAAAEFPNSLTHIILSSALSNAQTADELKRSIPFSDTIILNTQFAEDKVEQYLRLLQYNHNDTIIKHVDSLISEGGNRELQGRLAYTAYQFFYDSQIMGQERIAVDIAQKWFLSDKLEWPNKEGKFMLRSFVEFNRHSLIGMDAPELVLKDTLGEAISLRSMEGEYTILYFYTDDCITCRRETPQLVDFVNGYEGGPLSVYAVYADSKEERWKKYIEENLFIYSPFMNWVNVYDPQLESNFQMLYNVIKTPQMFLLDREKKIVGRGLDVKALKELLEERNRQRDETRGFILQFFTPMGGNPQRIQEGIDMFCNSSKGDENLLKEFLYEIYHTLGRSQDYTLQQGAIYLAEKYILEMPQLWDTPFLEKTANEVKIFNMNKLGDIAADMVLETPDGSSIGITDIPTEYKVLYFYRPNCGMCAEVTPKVAQLWNEFREKLDIEVMAINLGGNYAEWIEYITANNLNWTNVRGTEGDSSEIYGNYHLEQVPTIYLLKDNVVVAKDINDIELKETLNTIIQ